MEEEIDGIEFNDSPDFANTRAAVNRWDSPFGGQLFKATFIISTATTPPVSIFQDLSDISMLSSVDIFLFR